MLKRKLFVEMKSKQWSNEDTTKWMAHYALPRTVQQVTRRNPECWAISSLPFPDFPKTRCHTSEYKVTSEQKPVETLQKWKWHCSWEKTSISKCLNFRRYKWHYQRVEEGDPPLFSSGEVTQPLVCSAGFFTTRVTWTYCRESRLRPWR